MTAPAFRAVTQADLYSGQSSTLTINKPSGTVTNDLLLCHLTGHFTSSSYTWTPPTGWSLFHTRVTNFWAGGYCVTQYFTKTATSSEPSSYTFTVAPSGQVASYANGTIACYVAAALADNAFQESYGSSWAGTVVLSNWTPTARSDVLEVTLGHAAGLNAGATATPISAVTERWDATPTSPGWFPYYFHQYVADELGPSSGPYGIKYYQYAPNSFYSHAWLRLRIVPGFVAPLAPVLLSPANSAYVDFSTVATPFSWQFQDPNPSDTQAKWALRRKVLPSGSYSYWNEAAGTWDGTIVWNTGSTDTKTFAAGVGSWAASTSYGWSIATEDPGGLQGSFATDRTVFSNSRPVVSSVSPTGTIDTNLPTIAWTYTDSDSDPQEAYCAKIFLQPSGGWSGLDPDTATAAWDSGVVISAAVSITLTATIGVDGSYRAYVKARQQGDLWSAWAYSSFTVALDSPATPTILATADATNGRIQLALQGRDNLLSQNSGSAESTDLSEWQYLGCSLSRESVGYVGTYSLGITGQGTVAVVSTYSAALVDAPDVLLEASWFVDVRLIGAADSAVGTLFDAVAGQTYTWLSQLRSASSAVAWHAELCYFNANGDLLGSTVGSTVTSTTDWQSLSASGIAPSGTAYVAARVVSEASVASGVLHYIDAIYLGPGTALTDWVRGGFVSALWSLELQRSDDDGTTWTTIGNHLQSALFDLQNYTFYDYTAVPNYAIQYRVRAVAISETGTILYSAWATVTVTLTSSSWWLKDPSDSALNISLEAISHRRLENEDQARYEPLSRPNKIVLTGELRGVDHDMEVEFYSKAELDAFRALRATQHVLLLQSGWTAEQWYVRIGNDVTVEGFNTTPPTWNVKLEFTEVDAP